jgi:hypothetical protein
MSTRNYDAQELTKLKRDRNEAAFFQRQIVLQNAAQTGVVVNQYNGQTGVYNASKMGDIANGSFTTYYRASPATIISVPCFCVDVSFVPVPQTANINVPIQQPVNDSSPFQ